MSPFDVVEFGYSTTSIVVDTTSFGVSFHELGGPDLTALLGPEGGEQEAVSTPPVTHRIRSQANGLGPTPADVPDDHPGAVLRRPGSEMRTSDES